MGFKKWKTVITSFQRSRNLLKDKCGKRSQTNQQSIYTTCWKAIFPSEQQYGILNINMKYINTTKKSIFDFPTLESNSQEFTQALSSPKIMVVMATIWGSRQYLTLEALKTLHADCAITRSNKDFGHICRAELHPPYKITSSLLRGHNRQIQAC